ncbi:hypothetical protein IWX49DRAFT_496480 [Phyllosticta citricarpa]|uniref:Fumarylacetoacetase-like C-terminal domain-containing protein n=2 Tax=Phyllosticta TaxID=121621 RepID=A0ABR1MLV5_9PEZI
MGNWTHLIRFVAKEDGLAHYGQVDAARYPDVGLAMYEGKEEVRVKEVTGGLYDGIVGERELTVQTLLPPLQPTDIPLIRCMGLNYRDHAREANMAIPTVPILFIKPRTAINGPHPSAIPVPKLAQDGTSDYEAELTVVIGKEGRDIPESKALEHVLAYTAGNDVSARTQQFATSQWSFSKGFDGSAPVGPVLVAPHALPAPDAGALRIRALHNGAAVQDSNTREMIFGIAKQISFLSQGTTLERGTVIMTGTGPGVGIMRDPKVVLKHGDDMRVEIEGIGTLVNRVVYE